MADQKPKPDPQAVTFQAPADLVEKLDQLAAREMTSRASLLRRLALAATREATAA